MADTEYDLFDDNDSDLPKKLRAKIKELQKENEELSSKFAAIEADRRKTALGNALAERGLNPKIAAFVPQDIEGEALDTWLSEYGDVFGGQPAPQQQAAAQQSNRMNALEQGAQMAPPADIMSRIENAENMDELMAALKGA